MNKNLDVLINDNEDIEVILLIEAIWHKYGYDFKGYSKAHIKRRIKRRMVLSGCNSILDMAKRVLDEREFFESLLSDFSINVTEMFRDPEFYKVFRREVVPILRTYPFLKIWHAGCATGEEVYSMAILLKEENLYDRSQIYATDFNTHVLEKAKEGIYSIEHIREYTQNYQRAGGAASFADYYIANYQSVIFDSSLKKKIIFADHNLVTDGVFGEMQVILCRNVLIYFERDLQGRVIKLFDNSLCSGGFICLGTKETIKYTDSSDKFEEFSDTQRIYRKKFIASKD